MVDLPQHFCGFEGCLASRIAESGVGLPWLAIRDAKAHLHIWREGCALAPVAHEGHQMIDARGLHEWLGSKDYYHQWMKLLIEEYGFTEPNDYCTISCVRSDGKAGRRKISHYLTINVDL